MSENSSLPEVSVVICSYSEDRWDRLIGALDSVRTQTFPPKQTIVVVDYNFLDPRGSFLGDGFETTIKIQHEVRF